MSDCNFSCDFSDTGAVLYQLSSQTKWEPVILWVHNNLLKMEINTEYTNVKVTYGTVEWSTRYMTLIYY